MARPVTGPLVGRMLVGGLLGASLLGLAACAADQGGIIAVGGGAPAPVASTPSGKGVVFVPLDPSAPPGRTPGGSTGGTAGSGAGDSAGTTASGGSSGGTPNSTSGSAATTGTTPTLLPPATTGSGNGRSGGTGAGGTGAGSSPGAGGNTRPSAPATPSAPSTPQSPASLAVAGLTTAATADRWCQQVTLKLVNSGSQAAPATGTTVTFATHVIGLLGIDWWTYQTSQALSAPVPGHATVNETWNICLDSWRVPAGMHLDTEAATLS